MKLLLVAALLACAAPLFAAPRKCSNGQVPKLSGDLFSPVECSTKTLTAVPLPGLPAVTGAPGAPSDLKDLKGRWEGVLIHALGRYELLLSVKTSRGKTEMTLDSKEQQFRERASERLILTPAKTRGAYALLLTTSMAPDASLAGTASVGMTVQPEAPVSTGALKILVPPPDRQADLTFANGAVYRIFFAVKDKAALRVRALVGIPGASLQKMDVLLKRTKREAL